MELVRTERPILNSLEIDYLKAVGNGRLATEWARGRKFNVKKAEKVAGSVMDKLNTGDANASVLQAISRKVVQLHELVEDPSAVAGLKNREILVIHAMYELQQPHRTPTNSDIAEALCWSPKSVENRFNEIHRRLGVANRTGALVRYIAYEGLPLYTTSAIASIAA